MSGRPDVRILDPDRELVELRGGPFDGRWISVGRDVVRTELPLFAGGGRDLTMHEYARADTAVAALRHAGCVRHFGGKATPREWPATKQILEPGDSPSTDAPHDPRTSAGEVESDGRTETAE